MKIFYRCLFSLSLSIFFSTISYGQVKFGIKSGINIATVKDLNIDPHNRIGWYGGGFANIAVRGKFFFHTELLFSTKGYRFEGNIINNKKTAERLNYITLPVLLGYKIDHKTSFFLGPEIGYLLSVYSKTPYNELFDVSNSFPVKVDIELTAGLNYEILRNISLEIRYTYGLKNMYSLDGQGMRIGYEYAGNRVFQMGLRFNFLE
jgi:hypothetical protein